MPTDISSAADSDDSRTGDALRQPGTPAAATSLRLAMLHTLVGQLTQELDPDAILQQALEAIRQLNRWQHIGLSLSTSDGLSWQTRAADPLAPGEAGPLHPLSGVVGRAYRTGQIQVVPDVGADPDFVLGEGFTQADSVLVIPIVFDRQVLGALTLASAQPAAFDQDDITFAQSIAQILAIALSNARRSVALQTSEARYRLLFATMAQGVVYHAADGAVIDANPAAQRILGLTLDQLQGRSSAAPGWKVVREDGATLSVDAFPAMVALRTGQPMRGQVVGVDTGGSAERRWVSVDATPLFHPGEDRPFQVYTTFDDITERRLAEVALQRSEAELRTVLDCTPDFIFTVDRQLRLQFVNRVPPGMTMERVLGVSILINVMPEHRDLVERTIRRVFETGEPAAYEIQAYGPHEASAWYATRLAPVLTGGETTRVLLVTQDITQAREAQERLRRSEERLRLVLQTTSDGFWIVDPAGRFLEVNQAYSAMSGYTREELLQLGIPDVEAIERVEETGQRIARIIREGGEQFETQHRRKDGSVFDVEVSVNLLDPAQGLIVAFCRDITARKRAEEQLRQREADYRYLFEHHPHPMWAFERGTLRFLAVNNAAVAKYGYTRDEFLRMTIADIRPPEDVEQLRVDLAQPRPALRHSGPWRHRLKDGALIDVEITSHLIQLFGREVSLVVAQDVTTRLRAEAALRMSEARFATIFEHSPIAITISRLRDNQLIQVNTAFLTLTGYAREEVLDHTALELGLWSRPEDRPQIFGRLLRRQRVSSVETALRQSTGNERNVIFSGEIVELNGEPCALIQLTDITDLKAAQQELLGLNRTLEERVEQRTAEVQDLYERAPAGYHSLDPDGRVIRVNQTELGWLGYTREELIGRPFTDLLTLPSQEAFPADFRHLKERGEVRDVEVELIRKDGSTFAGLINATAIYDDAGRFVMSRSTLVDLTERKAIEVALRQANAELARAARAKDEFLANMSHELRTPLNAILGYSEMLLEELRGPLNAYQQTALRQIAASGQHLLALITDVLDLAKVEAGHLDVRLETVPLADMCQASLLFVKEQALKKSLRLDFHMSDALVSMEADPKRLKQMLVNLLTNAVKFTPSGGRVLLEVVSDAVAGVVRFAVEDTGIGIAPEELARLFQPFVQLDSSLSRQHEGSGLGLALVRRLAELHGGSVTVASEVGRGSRFTITLPYRPPHIMDGPQAGVPLDEGRSAAGLAPLIGVEASAVSGATRILLAEDNIESLQLVGAYLGARGYTVIVARNGREAVSQAEALYPDLILMDIQLPELDGLEAIRRIRAAGLGRIPIIALTALAMPGDRERCLDAGATAYLAKPVNLRILAATVAELLATPDAGPGEPARNEAP